MPSRLFARKRTGRYAQDTGIGHIDMIPVDEEIISAKEFLKRYEAGDINAIKNAEIIMPRLGGSDFGAFKIKKKGTYAYG